MITETATYIREFEDYTDGYDDIPSPRSIEEEEKQINESVSSLEERTLKVSINQERTNKQAFGVEGRVYRRIAIISQEIDGGRNLKEQNLLENALTQLGYQKIGL